MGRVMDQSSSKGLLLLAPTGKAKVRLEEQTRMRDDGRTASGRRETTRGCASFHAREEKTIDVLAAHSVTDLEGDSQRRKE